MPIYAFKCIHCGKTGELVLSIKERAEVQECDCGGSMKRLVTCCNFNMNPEKMGVYTKDGKFVEGHFEK